MVTYSAFEEECKAILNDSTQLDNFRTRRQLGLIVETLSREQGKSYFKHLKRYFPQVFDRLESLTKIDQLGNPAQHQWADSFKSSALMLRYMLQAELLYKYMGELAQKNILEIGGGFGGHAAVLQTLYPSASHTIVDLPAVSQLQSRYLKELSINAVTYPYASPGWQTRKYDIIVSHYCFSELDASVQDLYMQTIRETPHGFMICNIINRKSHHKNKIIAWIRAAHPGLKVLDEEPETFRGNYVLVW